MDGLISTKTDSQAQLVPPERPLEMPIQSLKEWAPSETKIKPAITVWITRLVVSSGTVALTAYATRGMYEVVGQSTATAVQILLVALFAATFCWIALTAITALIGLVVLIVGQLKRSDSDPVLSAATAVVLPIHNENPQAVFASLQAMVRELGERPKRGSFDFFVLSDSTNLAIARREFEAALAAKAAESRKDSLPATAEQRRQEEWKCS